MTRGRTTFEAYLDDEQKIVVYLGKMFYNGHSTVFYLRDAKMQQRELRIVNINESGTATQYILTCPTVEIGQHYEIIEEHSLSTTLQFGLITKTASFARQFAYSGDDLGAQAQGNATSFALWAPTANQVYVQIDDHSSKRIFEMTRHAQGVYRLQVQENLHGASYLYIVYVNGQINVALDPYGIASIANEKASVVIDRSRLTAYQHSVQPFDAYTDATIMEVSVRDFSMNENSGMKDKGQFKAMSAASNPALSVRGIDYLSQLGVNTIQLMPIQDFATVDEMNRTVFYNWGYDPVQYSCLEGSYSSDPNSGTARLQEFIQLVDVYHERGFHIVMDVVFNHVYISQDSSFEKIVPYYYFRCDQQGNLSNGSYCGNDFDSTMVMGRKLILDSVRHWLTFYNVDGFRFDLMGILDVETINQVVALAHEIKPGALIYGEGWNMPTMLPDEEKAMLYNGDKLPEVAFFNDFFRDHVKGRSSENELAMQGYLTGDVLAIQAMRASLAATATPTECVQRFQSPTQSINYVECHDNHTCWDKLKVSNVHESKAMRIARQKLLLAAVILAQGIPFIQMGQEFCRSKNNIGNTYNSPDRINSIDWQRKDMYQTVVDFTAALLRIRRENAVFRLSTSQAIQKQIHFYEWGRVLEYRLQDENRQFSVVFNPTYETANLPIKGKLILTLDGLVDEVIEDTVAVSGVSMVIIESEVPHVSE